MTSIDTILARLEKVRQRQFGQWSARCPAHADRGPSRTSQIVSLLDTDAWNHAVGVESAEIESMQSFLQTWNKSIAGQASKYSRGHRDHGD